MAKRMLSSLFNILFCWLNVILWIFNVNPVGTLIFGTDCPNTRKGKFVYGLCSLLQWILMVTIVGTIFVIIFWAKGQPSIAQRLAKLM
ncbi:hypothetical protein S100390_v1c03110 [Spiroplasma sp. NBRC 100390]|uniref:hypothetical protein n=1 Tax=unclassified Spiroplasma TaxID=2637901 RepID=UPI0008928FCF|nr:MULTISPECIES: hypothetical protein [unclassified Spiroplasma]AOX43654.1 hypothetical protein STU14_v1c03110 [Spiroplasma sp. TU-14]APE13124.1 hypothetical protein S100390_v1c03110 [Spiroplasma sp. NBRC 100390]